MTFKEQFDAMFAEMDDDQLVAFFNENYQQGDIGPQADPDVEGWRTGHLFAAGAALLEIKRRFGHGEWNRFLREWCLFLREQPISISSSNAKRKVGLLMDMAKGMSDAVGERMAMQ